MAAFDALKDHSVVLFVDSREDDRDMANFNPVVAGALTDDRFGNIIPWAVTFSPTLDATWSQHKHGEMLGDVGKKHYREASKAVKARLANLKAGKPADATLALPVQAPLKWKIEGARSFHTGKFVKLEGDKLHLDKDGTAVVIPMDRITKPAQEYAKNSNTSTSAAVANTLAKPKEPAKPEAWTSSDGKTITATFMSLEGDHVVLKMANGKEAKLPINRLSADSQTKAKELAK